MCKQNKILMFTLSAVFVMSLTVQVMASDESIDKEFNIQSGDAQLYVKVRGQDVNNPVLLYLHGGPGETFGPLLFQAYAGPELEKHYVVAYLHQRNTCMSPDAPHGTLTLDHFIKDVANTVEYLRDRFNKDKIFLLGHSFGGYLGNLYLLEENKHIEKFVSVAGAFSVNSVLDIGYQMVLELAKLHGTKEAVKQLEDLGPTPSETFEKMKEWRRIGMDIQNKINTGLMKNLDTSKFWTITALDSIDPEWQNKSMTVGTAMYDEITARELENEVDDIEVPLLLLAGTHDIMSPVKSLKKGYENYGGKKQFFVFENSNHFIFMDEPDLFVSKVIEFFRE